MIETIRCVRCGVHVEDRQSVTLDLVLINGMTRSMKLCDDCLHSFTAWMQLPRMSTEQLQLIKKD